MTTPENPYSFANKKFLNIWHENLAGIQLNENNASEVSRWVGPNASVVIQDNQRLVKIATNRGDVLVNIGDYVTIDADRRFKIICINPVKEGTTAQSLFSPVAPFAKRLEENKKTGFVTPKPGNHLKK